MRHFLLLGLIALAGPALADACTDEVKALFKDGPLDPFVQGPYLYDTTVLDGEGAVKMEYYTVFDTPVKSMNGLKGHTMYLNIGNRTWSGPSPDGPWTQTPSAFSGDPAAFQMAIRDQLARNISDARCHGTLDHEGTTYTQYEFTSQTDPNPDQGGSYFGSTYTVFIDPDTNLVMRQENTGQFSHYQPEPGTDTWVRNFTYDPSISLVAPNE